jgi:ABC-type sugar transport system permease subunit
MGLLEKINCMRQYVSAETKYKVIALSVLGLAWLYLTPVWLEMWDGSAILDAWKLVWGEPSVWRTLCISFSSALLGVMLGFWSAIALRRVEVQTFKGRLLAVLLLPIVVGDLAIGLVIKLQFMNSEWLRLLLADRPTALTLSLLIGIQVWQIGSLFTYLFWLRIRAIPKNLTDFGAASDISGMEFARDILWPNCRDQAVLLLLMGFLLSAQEFSKSQLILRVSVGTNTALVSHWLAQTYNSNISVGADLARKSGLHNSAALFLIFTIAGGIFTLVASRIISGLVGITGAFGKSNNLRPTRKAVARRAQFRHRTGSRVLVAIVASLIIIPFARALVFAWPSFSQDWFGVAMAAGLAILGGTSAATLAVVMAFTLRVGFQRSLDHLGLATLMLLITLLSLQAIPPLAISLCGYAWFGHIVGEGKAEIFLAWLAGQMLLSLPWLGSFSIWVHSRVATRELEFQKLTGLNSIELARASFWDRFRLDYGFLLFFAWTLVWNESALNKAVSDSLPSLIDLLGPRIGARPDYAKGLGLVAISFFLGCIAVISWNQLLRNNRELRND